MLRYSLLIILFGTLMILYAYKIYDVLGQIDWLEKYFGSTKTGLQMLGLFIIIITILVTTGALNFLLAPFMQGN